MSAMDAKTALDHLRSYYTRQVKPFKDLLDVVEIADRVSQDLPAAQVELARLQAECQAAQERLTGLARQVEVAEARAETSIRAATDRERAARTAAQNAEAEAEARRMTLEREHQVRMREMDQAAQQRLRESAEERATLDQQVKELRDTLAALRQRFQP